MKKLNQFQGMRDFLILWSGQAVSSLGSSMVSYALIIWGYQQSGTASSVALLSFFTYLPSVFLCFIAGALADRWDKKKIMLAADGIAALGTVVVFSLYAAGRLEMKHLYGVNFVISFANAFQNPASYVATSLLVPSHQYVRASGLQAFSGSAVTILTPALATAALAFGNLNAVFLIDLVTFAFAFLTLGLFIRIPKTIRSEGAVGSSIFKSCTEGLRFLRRHRALLDIILFFTFINLIAFTTSFGIMPAMILARSGNNQVTLGMVSGAVGVGAMVGSVLVTAMKPAKNRVRVIFLSCALSFAVGDVFWAIGRNVAVWVSAAFAANLLLPFLNANLSTLMRSNVPIEMQGRVFSARDTLQYSTVPIGLFLGGTLADRVFEPFMRVPSAFQGAMAALVGSGDGSGMALMFLITGVVGCLSSFAALRSFAKRRFDH